MIYEVELSEQADSDLRGIFEYIAFELQWLNEKVTSTIHWHRGVRTFSWTKLLFLNYVYTEMDSFHPTIF